VLLVCDERIAALGEARRPFGSIELYTALELDLGPRMLAYEDVDGQRVLLMQEVESWFGAAGLTVRLARADRIRWREIVQDELLSNFG
jgi:hypothetical protein